MAPKSKAKVTGHTADAITGRKRDALRAMMKVAEPVAKQPPVVPRGADMILASRCIIPPPESLANKLGDPPACFCFAVKIHDWPSGQCNLKRLGRFGYYTNASDATLEYGRLVQLGWSARRDSTTDICPMKTAQIAPAGWAISATASTYGVDQAMAERDGRPLREVLEEFCKDMDVAVRHHGCRVVAHHIEHAATFVQKELGRVGLTNALDVWTRTARQGYCLMDPELSDWLRRCDGQGRDSTSLNCMSLLDITKCIWPDRQDQKTHTGRPMIDKASPAGVTAGAVCQIYQAILARAFGAKAATTTSGDASTLAPMPKFIRDRLKEPGRIVAVDIETHGWPLGPSRTTLGEFGWHFFAEDRLLDFARVCQLGWACGYADMRRPPERKCYLVKPTDFAITIDATKCHGITQAEAVERGRPLVDVLKEFMADVMAEHASGGRICAHHLSFDAGIILRELRRSGLDNLATTWSRIATDGYCTMNKDMGGWLLPQCSKASQRGGSEKEYLSLKTVAEALNIPDRERLLAHHHNAGADAEAAFQVLATVLRRTRLGEHGAMNAD